jgi:hypothetical protein
VKLDPIKGARQRKAPWQWRVQAGLEEESVVTSFACKRPVKVPLGEVSKLTYLNVGEHINLYENHYQLDLEE